MLLELKKNISNLYDGFDVDFTVSCAWFRKFRPNNFIHRSAPHFRQMNDASATKY